MKQYFTEYKKLYNPNFGYFGSFIILKMYIFLMVLTIINLHHLGYWEEIVLENLSMIKVVFYIVYVEVGVLIWNIAYPLLHNLIVYIKRRQNDETKNHHGTGHIRRKT